jgi:hypothetical protein
LVQGGSVKDALKAAVLGGATGALTAGFSGQGDFMSNVSADVSMGTTNIGNAFSQGSFAPLQSTTGPSIEGLFDGKSSVNNADMASTTVDSSDFATSASGQQPGTFGADGSVQVAGLEDGLTNVNLAQKPIPQGEIIDEFGSSYYRGANNELIKLPPQKFTPSGEPLSNFNTNSSLTPQPVDSNVFGVDNFSNYQPPAMDPYQANALKLEGVDVGVGGNQTITSTKPKSMFETFTEGAETAGDYVFRGGSTKDQIIQAQDLAQQKYLANAKLDNIRPTQAGIDAARASAGPSMYARYGPSLAVAGIAGAAGGMFDTPKEDEGDPIRTGQDVYNENPDIYNVGDLEPIYIPGDSNVGTKYPYYRPRNVQTVAQGGQIFPRRVGGIMPNEGIPNQDSVRAMLMPGEFVMTTDAVKGLGGGDMNKGINNMYGVMRNLEQRGRRA